MRILILGEGPTDLGRVKPDGSLDLEGTLPILVSRLIGECTPQMPIEVRALESNRKPRRFPESARRMERSQHGYANKLWGLLGLKEGREADAIVMVVDRDGPRNKDRIEELNKGREDLRRERKACAVGIAIEMIEAWLLADERALRSALGLHTIERQPNPESLTAKDETSDHHPKGRLRQLLEQALGREIPRSDFPAHYANIARSTDIRVLEQRCPEGFQPFAKQIRELLIA